MSKLLLYVIFPFEFPMLSFILYYGYYLLIIFHTFQCCKGPYQSYPVWVREDNWAQIFRIRNKVATRLAPCFMDNNKVVTVFVELFYLSGTRICKCFPLTVGYMSYSSNEFLLGISLTMPFFKIFHPTSTELRMFQINVRSRRWKSLVTENGQSFLKQRCEWYPILLVMYSCRQLVYDDR
jgi:hypothetical protein